MLLFLIPAVIVYFIVYKVKDTPNFRKKVRKILFIIFGTLYIIFQIWTSVYELGFEAIVVDSKTNKPVEQAIVSCWHSGYSSSDMIPPKTIVRYQVTNENGTAKFSLLLKIGGGIIFPAAYGRKSFFIYHPFYRYIGHYEKKNKYLYVFKVESIDKVLEIDDAKEAQNELVGYACYSKLYVNASKKISNKKQLITIEQMFNKYLEFYEILSQKFKNWEYTDEMILFYKKLDEMEEN